MRVGILMAMAVVAQSGIAQETEFFKLLPPNPDLVISVDQSQLEKLGALGQEQSQNPAETVMADDLLGIPWSSVKSSFIAGYNIQAANENLAKLDWSQMGQPDDTLKQVLAAYSDKAILLEKISPALSAATLETATSQFESARHGNTEYFRIGSGNEKIKSMIGEKAAFFLADSSILVVGHEDMIKRVIDLNGRGSRPELLDLKEPDMSIYMMSAIPEGSVSADAIPGASENPMIQGLIAMFGDMRVAGVGMSFPAGNLGIKIRMKFSDPNSASGLEAPLQAIKSQFSGALSAGNDPMGFGAVLSGLSIVTSGDVLSISTVLPAEMLQNMASSAQSGFTASGQGKADFGDQVRLVDGSTIGGEILDPIDEGIIVKLATGGGLSRRIHWSEMDIPTLESFNKFPRTSQFVRDYIPKERAQAKEIYLQSLPEVARPNAGRGFLASVFMTPIGIGFLILLYVSNIWAGMEVAIFRGHPVPLVAGASAIMPVISPLIFYFIPTESNYSEEYIAHDDADFIETQGTPNPVQGSAIGTGAPKGFTMPEPTGGGLSLSGGKKPDASAPTGELEVGQRRVFKRGEAEINRSFIEQNFVPFFRTVISGPEKDQLLEFKTPKSTVIGKRISRMSSNEVYVVTQTGAEQGVRIAEIIEILVRHKNDR